MSIRFACPYCDHVSTVPDSFAGKTGKCPACSKVIQVPDPALEEAAVSQGAELPDPSAAPTVPTPRPPAQVAADAASPGGTDSGPDKPCPYCGESIKAAAAKCRFCGEFLAGKPERTPHVGSKPDNSLGLAIGATVASLFCGMCWPLGLAAIVCAAQVDSRWNAGDRSGAERMALWARRLAWWTIGLTLAFWLLIGIAAVLDSL